MTHLLTETEAAALAGVTRRTIQMWRHAGRLAVAHEQPFDYDNRAMAHQTPTYWYDPAEVRRAAANRPKRGRPRKA